jgi:uncharacterized protein (DUF1330 family)
MTKAYVLLQFIVSDAETFGRYRQSASPMVLANGGKVLVGGSKADVREGHLSSEAVTILEFPSKEAAEAWYASPEYQAVKHLRTDSTSGSLAFLEGFTPPPPSA